jgi:hypothetical protein
MGTMDLTKYLNEVSPMSATVTLERVSDQSTEESIQQNHEHPHQDSPESIDIQELAIVLVAKGFNPMLFNPDFFINSGIVPRDWQLARQPVLNQQATQLIFQNGIAILAEPGKITFSEAVSGKSNEQITIAKMAAKCVETMPKAEYQAIGINPKRVVSIKHEAEGAQSYLKDKLLCPGEWQEFGQAPMQASLNLAYQLEDCSLNLNINPTQLRLPNETTVSGLLFAGNFHYDVTDEHPEAKSQQILMAIGNWAKQLEAYRSLLDDKFLPKSSDS